MSIKNYKYLNIKGAVLDDYQFQNYMEKVASSHQISKTSQKNTYPIPRLKDNFNFIQKTYKLLNEHVKVGIDIHPAGEWLLDNFYIIEEVFKTVNSEMNLKKYKEFPKVANGIYKGYARIYVLASEIVAYTDNKINDEILNLAIASYQRKKLLNMEEIWNLWIFLSIAIIENIRSICEKIYFAQLQKYKVENIIERLVEKKENKKQIFKNVKSENMSKIVDGQMKYPFIEYMSYKLKKYGKQGMPYLNILEEQVNKMGMTISELIKKEHYDIAISKVSIGNSITSLKEISRVNFLSLFEQINAVEEILKKDPAKVYEKMDYKTKEYYRNEIKDISEKTRISEMYIAKKTVELANREDSNKKKMHIGYYLIDEGKAELFKKLGVNNKKNIQNSVKARRYITFNFLITTILSLLMGGYIYNISKNIAIALSTVLVLYLPISEIVIQSINYILNKKVKPKLIPKVDFMQGVPEEYSTFIVIPTIINGKNKVKELMKKLEVYYLANKSENLYFALLGDCTSGKNKIEKFDDEIIEEGLKEVERLNKKYDKNFDGQIPKFNFLYRERSWNDKEQSYLGWERKRGLLCQFNEFLVDGTNNFRINTIANKYNNNVEQGVTCDPNQMKNNSNMLAKIKYVITLDSDTNLSLESGLELIGAMAHILNKPIVDENKNIVVSGHGLIQPRIGTDLESSRKSIFTKTYAGAGGIDSYTNAISDIYEDNFR